MSVSLREPKVNDHDPMQEGSREIRRAKGKGIRKGSSHSPFLQALTMFGYAAISNFCPAFFSLTTEMFVRICGMQEGGFRGQSFATGACHNRLAGVIHCNATGFLCAAQS
jgi:hypothetical protein